MVGNKRGEIRKEVILRIIMLLLSALVLFPFLYLTSGKQETSYSKIFKIGYFVVCDRLTVFRFFSGSLYKS